MGTFLLPLIQSSMPIGDLVILIHAQYLMLGFMVGAFSLLWNEVMNPWFGVAGVILLVPAYGLVRLGMRKWDRDLAPDGVYKGPRGFGGRMPVEAVDPKGLVK